MRLTIPYGDRELEFDVPSANLLDVIQPGRAPGEENAASATPSAADELAAVRRALAEPIGAPRLAELAAGAASAAIVVSDVTRPCPSWKFLPRLLEELGPLPPQAVTILFALGGHRAHTPEEQAALVGPEVAERGVRLVDLDREDCVPVGTTSRGTPLAVSRAYLEADLRVCTGNIDYHYFAGFSGGAKAVVPGLCTYDTIRANHGMMLHPSARAGVIDGNPVRDDIDEAGGMLGIDFILNVVLDEDRRIIHAVAGDYLAAHRAGVAFYDERYDLRIDEAADVVVASPGGAPKDMNLYQAQKTLDNVAGAVRDGGVVVLVARCDEDLGNAVFEEWMRTACAPADLVDRIKREFVLGGHKAAAIGALLGRVELYMVSDMPDELVRGIHMTPFAGVGEAVTAALQRCGTDARVLVVPHGNRVTAPAVTGRRGEAGVR